jgi:hypothetical protein
MSKQNPIEERASLLTELFLRELNPTFLAQASFQGNVWDYYAVFKRRNKPNLPLTVEVKASETPLQIEHIFHAPARQVQALVNAQPIVLVVVADVVNDDIGWGWASAATIVPDPNVRGAALVRLPLTRSNETTKKRLIEEIQAK